MASIQFKTPRQLHEFYDCEPLLQEIFYWIADTQWPSNVPAQVTSIFRTVQENAEAGATTQVHCKTPHCALDISVRLVPDNVAAKIVSETNRRFDYNHDGHPCAYMHDVGSGLHIHLQVFPGLSKRRA